MSFHDYMALYNPQLYVKELIETNKISQAAKYMESQKIEFSDLNDEIVRSMTPVQMGSLMAHPSLNKLEKIAI